MADAAAARLLPWLRASGGLVDAAIGVATTTAGRRGLVATQRIGASPRPLVALPGPLVLTPTSAATALSHFHGASPGLGAALAALDPAAPLAVLLALEAHTAPARPSPWGLYALALGPGARPPPGWAVPPGGAEVEASLAAAGVPPGDRPAWAARADAARTAAEGLAQAAAALVDRDRGRGAGRGGLASTSATPAPPPLPPAAVAWGVGHVVSRAFCLPATPSHAGGVGQPALLPVIDLANHAAGAADPAWAEAPGAPHRFATLRAAGGPGRAPVGLDPGDELATSYAAGNGGSPLEWWLNYGFVPGEVL